MKKLKHKRFQFSYITFDENSFDKKLLSLFRSPDKCFRSSDRFFLVAAC